MKLNPDCIRDILIAVEDNTGYDKIYEIHREDLTKKFPNYSYNEIMYHIHQCNNFGYIIFSDTNCYVYLEDLTPKGHLFLADIRDNSNWLKIKNIASTVGSFSLDALKTIATNVISQSIINTLTMNNFK